MENYEKIKNQEPETIDCFFAFSNEQFNEGVKKANLESKEILRSKYGLFGTQEGISNFLGFYDKLSIEISEKCDPQDCYNYEFINYECGYVCDDEEAIKVVVSYFGEAKAKTVTRQYGYSNIDTLEF